MEEVSAVVRNAPISAQKVRLVTRQVSKMSVNKAIDVLTFTPKKAAKLVKKALNSAIANAEHNNGMDIDDLFISTIFVDEARVTRRYKARAKGRANVITKRTCHITVKVAVNEE